MKKLFNDNRPSLEEFVETYKSLMSDDLELVKQEADFSDTEKEIIEAEHHLSFEILDTLLESAKRKEK